MKYFLTGATGKVGSRFAAYLLNKGEEVHVLVRDLERARFLEEQGAKLVLGNLSDQKKLAELIKETDVVVHLAAQFRNVSDEAAWKANVDGTQTLANAAIAAGVSRFVFSSTSLVYMDVQREQACLETEPLNPQGTYPKTKVAAEKILLDLQEKAGLDVRILRFAFVYGDGDQHLTEFAPIMSHWSPEQKMSMIHHHDICQALYLAAKKSTVAGSIYNVGDEEPSSIADLLAATNTTAAADTLPANNPFSMILNTTAIKNELGFEAKYPAFKAAVDADAL
ncbi:NAD(P)-dependent oxidoreductase [Enterococcus sp.]|uniref:NAD-dependent epimerase/dehydratase family protein n=1 Tax=Enterococcus sp. TaxID=35783 RepID=UPI00290FF7AB|nr:NAD(P)-dependent oxidoreductase [Enterococcus sp.]MDU5336643.1 NAD(P)-dependent oxidoreductase [Enterococcus sp.]